MQFSSRTRVGRGSFAQVVAGKAPAGLFQVVVDRLRPARIFFTLNVTDASWPAPGPAGSVDAWVHATDLDLESRLLAGLPIVNVFYERLGIDRLLATHVPDDPRPRCHLPWRSGW
jgi:hypothetical protein